MTGLCHFQGYTTLQLTCSLEMHNIGFAWKTLKEQLGEQIETHIHRMTFLKGKTVCDTNLILIRPELKSLPEWPTASLGKL